MWASNRERVSGVPTVGHLGKRLGHTPQSCGHATPLLRIKGGEFVEQGRVGRLGAGHDSSLLSATVQPHHLSVDWNHVSDVR
jgi:hypothetical protein